MAKFKVFFGNKTSGSAPAPTYKIYVGNVQVTTMYVGTTEVTQAYVGTTALKT